MRELNYNRRQQVAIYLDDAGMYSVVFVATQDVVAVYDNYADARQMFLSLISYRSVG